MNEWLQTYNMHKPEAWPICRAITSNRRELIDSASFALEQFKVALQCAAVHPHHSKRQDGGFELLLRDRVLCSQLRSGELPASTTAPMNLDRWGLPIPNPKAKTIAFLYSRGYAMPDDTEFECN